MKKEKFIIRLKDIEPIIKRCQERLTVLLKELCNMHKMTEFLKFAYELRKYDVNDDYSEKLIKEHVSIPVIYELVMANQFKDDSMEFNEFKL